MRKAYLKPAMNVLKIRQMQMFCGSPDVINPGADNRPAGAHEFRGVDWNDEEDY